MACIPRGGHIKPNSKLGESLLWKKVQKNEKKNRISEVINKIIPQRRPFITRLVWFPKKEPSREISRHHCVQHKIKQKLVKKRNKKFFVMIQKIVAISKFKVFVPVKRGQGLG